MFTALTIDNRKIEAEYKAIAFCQNCGHRVYPKCVTPGHEYLKAKHFFHANGVCCDDWYEPMSEWHYNWQAVVPIEQREVSIDNGHDRHIADIYLPKPTPPIVVELQKSNIPYDIKRKRDIFYNHVIWVVHSNLQKLEWVTSSTKPVFIDLLNDTLKTPIGTIITKEDFIKTVLLNPLLKYGDWSFGYDGEYINTRLGKKTIDDIQQGDHLVFVSDMVYISTCDNPNCNDRDIQTFERGDLIPFEDKVLFQCRTCGTLYEAYLLKFDSRGDDEEREIKSIINKNKPFFKSSMRQRWEEYKLKKIKQECLH